MKNVTFHLLALGFGGILFSGSAYAQNPLIMDQFTADPTARVFEGKIYVYPSHDIPAPPGVRTNWFCMEDYHVFSSENLMDWKDHGVIVSQTNVPWVDASTYSMWAPDCVRKNDRYYFYFPARHKSGEFAIGVAVSETPSGPFKPESQPIKGVQGIDPCVFIDADGSAYLYYSKGRILVARLTDNMLELASEPQVIDNLPTQGLLEGPFVFERNGIYYLTYPHVENETERLEYATGKSPLGPFQPRGVIKDESPSGCWTVHHSIVQYNGRWYLFYHDNDLSPDFDKNRSIRADRLFFETNGDIRKVVPTLRGIGIADAGSRLQIDRYSDLSSTGAAVSFVDETDRHAGWKITFDGRQAWVRFNQVDFGTRAWNTVSLRAWSPEGGILEIRRNREDGPLLATVEVDEGMAWEIVQADLRAAPSGTHDLFITQRQGRLVELDWIRFE